MQKIIAFGVNFLVYTCITILCNAHHAPVCKNYQIYITKTASCVRTLCRQNERELCCMWPHGNGDHMTSGRLVVHRFHITPMTLCRYHPLAFRMNSNFDELPARSQYRTCALAISQSFLIKFTILAGWRFRVSSTETQTTDHT